MIEYSILIGLITAVVIVFIFAVGTYVSGAWSLLCNNLSSGQTLISVSCSG